jgi:two-component system chemotaxis response regulator CheB
MISVKEAEENDQIRAGCAYVAPGNFHMEIEKAGENYFITLNQKPSRLGVRPSADLTFFSAVEKFTGKMVAVVLTGMGKDGCAGVEKMKARNAVILAQDKESSVIYGMPKAVIEKGLADEVASITGMKDALEAHIDRLMGEHK